MASSSRPTVLTKNPRTSEMLPHEIAFALSINPSHVDRALALDKTYHLRHRIFRRDRQQPLLADAIVLACSVAQDVEMEVLGIPFNQERKRSSKRS